MKEYADHRTLAEVALAVDSTRQAQVHATLALVEQQRIANLIALAAALPALEQATDGPEAAAREAAYTLIEYRQTGPDDEYPVIRGGIAQALGIKQ